jgi:peptidoglycan/LPS O-acetylase OafA/YrhL
MKYRSEIDGLRAIAVLPVIFFHAGFELFSGGYIGVDVFFVVSGYLITTILLEDIENNRFSLLNFYERRARRILPALTLMILICIPFAWNWMLPSQILDFAKSLVYVSLFLSNIFFWKKSGDGYFASNTEEIPLLHTWSLGIEEQYYLLFPIFLFLTLRAGKDRIFWMLILFAIISLGISEWGWRNERIANFYLTPSRVWEILGGSIAAFIVIKRGIQTNNFLSLVGIVAIFFAIFTYDSNTPFPSLFTLIPVAGTFLIILFASKQTLVAKLLSTRLLVGIGLISYSTYLWHQPLFVFSRLRLVDSPTNTLLIILSIFSLFLGFLSWKFIEKPFRKKNFLTRKRIFIYSFISLLIPIIIGSIIKNNSGFLETRKSGTGIIYQHYGYNPWNYEYNEPIGNEHCPRGFAIDSLCGFKKLSDDQELSANNIVWGDSFSSHAAIFLEAYEDVNIGELSLPSCAPFLSQLEIPNFIRNSSSIEECYLFNIEVQNYIRNNSNISNLTISSRFYLLDNMSSKEVIETAEYFKDQLNDFLKTVNRNLNIKIFPPPYTPPFGSSSCVNKIIVHGYNLFDCDFKINNISELSLKQNLFIHELSKTGLTIIPLNELICADGYTCSSLIDSIRILRDNEGHLRNEASTYFGKKLRDIEISQSL